MSFGTSHLPVMQENDKARVLDKAPFIHRSRHCAAVVGSTDRPDVARTTFHRRARCCPKWIPQTGPLRPECYPQRRRRSAANDFPQDGPFGPSFLRQTAVTLIMGNGHFPESGFCSVHIFPVRDCERVIFPVRDFDPCDIFPSRDFVSCCIGPIRAFATLDPCCIGPLWAFAACHIGPVRALVNATLAHFGLLSPAASSRVGILQRSNMSPGTLN